MKISPNDIDAHKLLGRIYLRQLGEGENSSAGAAAPGNSQNGVLDQAIAEFQKIVALEPKSVEDHMVLGQLYTVKHQPDKAESEFKTAQAIEPESEEVVLNLARLYAESGDLRARREVDRGGSRRRAHAEDGVHAGRAVRPDEAAQGRDCGVSSARRTWSPAICRPWMRWPQALLNDNQLDEALKQYKELAEANPDDAEPLIHIAEIERRQGKYEDALAVIRKARKMDPNSLEAGFNEGLLLDILGRLDDAIQTYQADGRMQPRTIFCRR